MARPRTYNYDCIVSKALEVFWQKGYADASIADLEEATQLKRTSLYAAFGDKEGISQAALSQYGSMAQSALSEQLASDESPMRALKSHFVNLVNQQHACSLKRGCFFNNACSERGECDQTQKHIQANRSSMLDSYSNCLSEGIKLGEIEADIDIAQTANFLITLQNGLVMSIKQGAQLEDLQSDIEIGFAAAGLPMI